MKCELQPVKLTELKYDYKEFEPVLQADMLEIHHKKHHQTYVDNFNKLLKDFLQAMDAQDTYKAQALLPKLHFNLGGHNCHDLFWKSLIPQQHGGGQLPSSDSKLGREIIKIWGSFDNFKSDFQQKGTMVQGSGWCWLALCEKTKQLQILTTPNQDSVEANEKIALLPIDVWEHAYYLQFKNLRGDFLKEIWKVVNWQQVESIYNKHA